MAVTQTTLEYSYSFNLLMWTCELCCSNTCFQFYPVAHTDIHVWRFTWKWKTPKAMDFSFSSLAKWRRGSLLQILSVLRKNIKVWSLQLTLAVVYTGESGPSFLYDQWPIYPVTNPLGWSAVAFCACKVVQLVLYVIGVLFLKEGITQCSNEIHNNLTNTRQHNNFLLEYIGYMFRPVNRSSSGLQRNKSQMLFRYWDPNIFTVVNVHKI